MARHRRVVGVWRVKTAGAPYPYHMFVFHSDGTMEQSNPPAGNKETSDTAGMGVWAEKDGLIEGRFEEFRVDYKTSRVTRGVVKFTLIVNQDTLSGNCKFDTYDIEDSKHLKGPLQAKISGERVIA